MTRKTFRRIGTTADLLGVLFALAESEFWSDAKISEWATEVLMQSETPETWLMDLVIVESFSTFEDVVLGTLQREQITLPEWAHSLTAGFLVLHHHTGDLSDDQFRDLFASLSDPEPIFGISIEQVNDLSLNDDRLLNLRMGAEASLTELEIRPVLPSILAAVSQ